MKVVMGPAPCIRCGRPVVFAEYVNRHGTTVRAICDPAGPAHRCPVERRVAPIHATGG